MDPLKEFHSLARQKSGQKPCPRCGKCYNNRAVPEYCSETKCKAYIGGKHKPKERPMDAMVLASSIVSVRQNDSGRPTRVFVDLKENKVNYITMLRIYLYSYLDATSTS